MNRAKILRTLSRHVAEIEGQFQVKALSRFGPGARDELRKGTDIDVLVDFDGAVTFDRYMDLKLYLEDLIGSPVDLVTVAAVKPRMWPAIESSLIHVA